MAQCVFCQSGKVSISTGPNAAWLKKEVTTMGDNQHLLLAECLHDLRAVEQEDEQSGIQESDNYA